VDVPFIPLLVIEKHGNQIAYEIQKNSKLLDIYEDYSSEEINLALAFGLIGKAVMSLVLVEDLKYGEIGFQVLRSIRIPDSSPSAKDLIQWVEAVFEGSESEKSRPNSRDVLSEIKGMPDQKLCRKANCLVDQIITDKWIVNSVLQIASETDGVHSFWFDAGLTYISCLYASMLMLKDTFEKSCLRNTLSEWLKAELNLKKIASHSVVQRNLS